MIDLDLLARIAGEGEGRALKPDELNEWKIPQVVVVCAGCNGGQSSDVCECGNTGIDSTTTADIQATLRALVRKAAARTAERKVRVVEGVIAPAALVRVIAEDSAHRGEVGTVVPIERLQGSPWSVAVMFDGLPRGFHASELELVVEE